MIVPVLRHVAARLTHATTGVNALRAGIPKESGDAAPPAVTVKTAADHPSFALGPITDDLLDAGPLLLVTCAGRGPNARGDDVVTVAIRYVAAPSPTFAFDTYQMLAAAERACYGPVATAGQAGRVSTQTGVRIFEPQPCTIVEPNPEDAATLFVPALVIPYPVLAPWLSGASAPA